MTQPGRSRVCQLNGRRLLLECLATLMLLSAEYEPGSEEGDAVRAALAALEPVKPKGLKPGDLKDWSEN